MQMKTLGLIGGVGPESTVEYYRFIVESYREKCDGNYPPIIINSVNLQMYIRLLNAGELSQFADELVKEVERLAIAGADFGAFASNTPHIVFADVQKRSRIPLVSIVEATRDRVLEMGLRKVGLLGTRFTMQADFYPQSFSSAGLELITPSEAEQSYIHDKYMNELLNNMFLPESRDRMIEIARSMEERNGIEALILGGTELPLLLRDADAGMPLLDTTRIHVDRLVSMMT
jgi:aspartate racemase